LARDISADKLDRLATLARYHTKNASSSSIKAVSPDSDLIDQGIKAVLKGNWKDANSIFLRVPTEFPQSDQLDRAQYWIARTEAKLGHEDEAKKRFEEIFTDNPLTYYGLQAAIYLKRDILPLISQPSSPFAAKWEGALTTRQALSLWRLRALLVSGLVDYAREEAKSLGGYKVGGAGIGQEDPKGALLLAKLFDTGGNYMASFSQAYAALSLDPSLLNRESVSLIFPQPFLDQFESAGELTGVSPLLLLSVAKQESAFLPNAISRADALGLMQLLPVTARTVVPGSDRSDLFDPKVNIRAGGLYMVKLLDKYQGNIALALAAYNAGPYRVSQWMKDLNEAPLMKESFDVDAFIDSIPFNETRKYVGNILRNYAWYKMLSKDESVTSVQELMFQWQKNQKSLAAKIETPKADLALPGPALPPPPQAEAQPIQARPPTPPPATALPANPSANP
jgi:soluble lytic murein transglycosylase